MPATALRVALAPMALRENRRLLMIATPKRVGAVLVAVTATLVVRYANTVAIALETAAPSRSIGTPARGALHNGRRLPTVGANFTTSSWLATALGRNSVHQRVRGAVLDAYAMLARSHPERRWMYAEASWPSGGRLRPHRTHQNGLSIDFVVPVRTREGRATELNSWVGNRWTYAIEFDRDGCSGSVCIDFDAMAAHLRALLAAAKLNGLGVRRVIFEPDYHRALLARPQVRGVSAELQLMPTRAWVRHDEHYHVDFSLIGES